MAQGAHLKRQDRVPEVHFYEWSVSRWRASETRALLTSAGRGIYREILDLCYVQGSIPKDHHILAVQCNCGVEELEAIWPIIARHFYQDKHDPKRLRNKFSEVRRRTFFQYVKAQKANAKKGGEAKAKHNTNLPSGGAVFPAQEISIDKKRVVESSRVSTKNTPPPPSGGVALDRVAQKAFLANLGWDGVSKASEDQITAIMDLKPSELDDDDSLGSLCMLNVRLWWFDEFWKAYWITDGKKQARITFFKVVTTLALHDKILAAILAQTPKMSRRARDKVPHASTWLNGANYDDPGEAESG